MSIVIPENVVDKQAYCSYVAYSRLPILNEGRFIVTSDGETVNLAWIPSYLSSRIAHLSAKEQDEIMSLKSKYFAAHCKAISFKRKAFYKQGDNKRKQQQRQTVDAAIEADVVTLLGRMFTVEEVIRIMEEDNHIQVTKQQVTEILKYNITAVERLREEYRNKVTDVRLYNKRPRLEELVWMYSKMKMRYVTTNGDAAYASMLRTLEQIRKEAEGDVLNINGALDVNITAELQAHVQQEIIKTINLKEIILGRVAARMNYDPAKLIAGLHNSYYNQFVQISGDYNPDAEMQYPSLVNYDFEEIERRNQQQVQTVKAEPVTTVQHQEAQTIRDLFIKRINDARQRYNQRISTTAVEQETQAVTVVEDYTPIKRSGMRKRYDRQTQPEHRNMSEEGKQHLRESLQRTRQKRSK